MRDERLLLRNILGALDRIDTFTRDMTSESFTADDKTVNAVIYNFLVIGEAVKLLPETMTLKHPEIPWRQIAGMRDKLTHAYFSVDHDLVWNTVRVVLPEFRRVIEKILKS